MKIIKPLILFTFSFKMSYLLHQGKYIFYDNSLINIKYLTKLKRLYNIFLKNISKINFTI